MPWLYTAKNGEATLASLKMSYVYSAPHLTWAQMSKQYNTSHYYSYRTYACNSQPILIFVIYVCKYIHMYTYMTKAQTLARGNISQLMLTLPEDAGKYQTKICNKVLTKSAPSKISSSCFCEVVGNKTKERTDPSILSLSSKRRYFPWHPGCTQMHVRDVCLIPIGRLQVSPVILKEAHSYLLSIYMI